MAFYFSLLLIFVALFSTAHGFSIQEATGVIPVTPRQAQLRKPIARTVSDAVSVVDTIVGFDHNQFEATREASKYIPYGGYAQFLKIDGLKGKRLGIVRNPLFTFANESALSQAFEQHFQTLRNEGAILVDHLEIANIQTIFNFTASGEAITSIAEFKLWLNAYLKDLGIYPVHSLVDSVRFNPGFSDIEMIKKFEEDIFLVGQALNGNGELEKAAVLNMARLRDGFVKLLMENQLDALVTACPDVARFLAIGEFPGIIVPAAYESNGVPIGVCFGGLKGSEPTLIEIAYGFEQATKMRNLPTFKL